MLRFLCKPILRPRLHETGMKSIRDDFVSVIVLFMISGTGMENAQTGLKSSCPLDRADYLQTGTNPDRDACEHMHIHLRPVSAAPSASEQRMLDKALLKNNNGRQVK